MSLFCCLWNEIFINIYVHWLSEKHRNSITVKYAVCASGCLLLGWKYSVCILEMFQFKDLCMISVQDNILMWNYSFILSLSTQKAEKRAFVHQKLRNCSQYLTSATHQCIRLNFFVVSFHCELGQSNITSNAMFNFIVLTTAFL